MMTIKLPYCVIMLVLLIDYICRTHLVFSQLHNGNLTTDVLIWIVVQLSAEFRIKGLVKVSWIKTSSDTVICNYSYCAICATVKWREWKSRGSWITHTCANPSLLTLSALITQSLKQVNQTFPKGIKAEGIMWQNKAISAKLRRRLSQTKYESLSLINENNTRGFCWRFLLNEHLWRDRRALLHETQCAVTTLRSN